MERYSSFRIRRYFNHFRSFLTHCKVCYFQEAMLQEWNNTWVRFLPKFSYYLWRRTCSSRKNCWILANEATSRCYLPWYCFPCDSHALGALLLSRCKDPKTTKSVIYQMKTTTLPKYMENLGYYITRWKHGKLYRTYEVHKHTNALYFLAILWRWS